MGVESDYKQLLDEVFVISRIIKVEVEGYQEIDYSANDKNQI